MIEVLYLLIGRLLLLCVNLYDLFWRIRERLHALFHRSYDYWRGQAARECLDRSVLELCKAELTKRPRHLVLVMAPDEPYVDAALLKRIFHYSLIMGIEQISVYDKREKHCGYVDLLDFCETSQESNSSSSSRSLVWQPQSIVSVNGKPTQKQSPNQNGYKNGTAMTTTTNGYKNGTHPKMLQVHQINSSDNHGLIADVCRELYEQRQTPLVQDLLQGKRELLTEHLSTLLNRKLGFVEHTEPELGIIFAPQTCTYGLLPWHIRFTEFHTHPSGRHFDVRSFANILYRYSRCEQRWGK